ncbi:MAG: hypothetical protein M1814_006609 [Vezdaea aestivalis]|nr:MAG: hypothetical protein M1814_006609 [Vezdaea aestivalis]
MAANYWVSSQRKHWLFNKQELAAIRRKLEDEESQLIQQYPLPERRLLSLYFNHQIIRLGKHLSIRQQAMATAQVFVRRFYTKLEIRRTNPYLVLATALYLACKMEECPQHIRHIVGEARTRWPDCLYTMDTAKLGECEFMLISEMNSQMIVHQPYRSLTELQAGLELTSDETALAWGIINDHFLTDLPLLYAPHVIAVTAVFMAVVLKPTPNTSAAGQAGLGASNASSGSNPSGPDAKVTPAKHQKMVSWLASTNIDLEAVIDCTQEIISLYEALEQYNEKACKEQIARVEKLWKILDTKGEGSLDLDALKKGLRKMDHPLKNADPLLHDIMKAVDTNGDGRIQYEEFRIFVEETEKELWKLFHSIDRDHNGKLDKAELQFAFSRAGLSVPTSKVDKFFEQVDTDHDGVISFEEWRNFLLFMPMHAPSLKAILSYYSSTMTVNPEGDVVMSDETIEGLGYFLAGGVSGVVSRTATAPLDRLKVYLIAQTEGPSLASDALQKGAPVTAVKNAGLSLVDATKALWRAGGWRSLFVGNGVNVIKVMPESAIKFGSYEGSKRLFAKLEGHDDPKKLQPLSRFVAGGLGGMASQFAVYPIDTLKFRMQSETFEGGLQGNALIKETFRRVWQQNGIRGFYRGLPMGLIGMFPYAAIDLNTFELLKYKIAAHNAKKRGCHEEDARPGSIVTAGIGAFSGAFGASAVYPLNLLRTRLQVQGTAQHRATYTGMWDVTMKTVQKEGVRGLFKGITPNLLKVVPAVSITYVVYEKIKQALDLK